MKFHFSKNINKSIWKHSTIRAIAQTFFGFQEHFRGFIDPFMFHGFEYGGNWKCVNNKSNELLSSTMDKFVDDVFFFFFVFQMANQYNIVWCGSSSFFTIIWYVCTFQPIICKKFYAFISCAAHHKNVTIKDTDNNNNIQNIHVRTQSKCWLIRSKERIIREWNEQNSKLVYIAMKRKKNAVKTKQTAWWHRHQNK